MVGLGPVAALLLYTFPPTYYFFTFLNDYLTSSISLPLKTIKKFDIIYIQGKERCLRRDLELQVQNLPKKT